MIYCVEDDRSIRELVVYALQGSGMEAQGLSSAAELDSCLSVQKPQLILLDIMLPGEDGMAILSRLKLSARTKDIPVIMLTARGSEFDKVVGLDSGADDYIPKPFGVMELISRIKAVLRRCSPREGDTLRAGELVMLTGSHKLIVSGKEVSLTLKEFETLRHLMENRSRVLSREQLLSAVWGYDYEGETRTVDVHINTLRQKIGDAAAIIETVRGVGYRIGEQNEKTDI